MILLGKEIALLFPIYTLAPKIVECGYIDKTKVRILSKVYKGHLCMASPKWKIYG
jgi:hypothetical protein